MRRRRALVRKCVVMLTLAAASIAAGGCNDAHKTETASARTLPALGAKADETSVSGISSGAYMAGQFQMAHAKRVVGAGIIAGGPYGCSESVFASTIPGTGTAILNLSKAVNGCMLDLLGSWGVSDPQELTVKAKERAARGEIDPIADVVRDRIYLFTGTADRTVAPSIVQHAATFYEDLGVPQSNIELVANVPAGHAFVTDDAGNACGATKGPYIVDCDYDQAGALLKQIYGNLEPRSQTPGGDFVEFDQRPFFTQGDSAGLAETGVVYVPKSCKEQPGCRVHIAFHGCAQNREAVGDAFIKESGFARWADTNRLVVLFPQTAASSINPQGCWDWWGYTGPQYLTRDAPQIAAVNRMLDALQAPEGGA
ncbi:poly(3-hydroxybutyrate) depolymerase [Hyphomicrobium sp.]|uniref:extracellular catalytic domain type 2 short-chain-length polyhydroxyalkanoate depolymerase n=1 Tax=Hyphomicrobium sp. TaxID=82 RepID=UPI002D76ECB3|nr:poly(3-hydroxybutyrate) depolymerase [Hyphomicrobium sp.]HET6388327.1 poly(3-hydroxybutyrate) depolymerase [Hyphomicrobium sp.]